MLQVDLIWQLLDFFFLILEGFQLKFGVLSFFICFIFLSLYLQRLLELFCRLLPFD